MWAPACRQAGFASFDFKCFVIASEAKQSYISDACVYKLPVLS